MLACLIERDVEEVSPGKVVIEQFVQLLIRRGEPIGT